MIGLVLGVACVFFGVGVKVGSAVKKQGDCRSAQESTPVQKSEESTYSCGSESSDYTPILDSPDFWMSSGGY